MEQKKTVKNSGDKFYLGQFGVILAFLVMVAAWLYMTAQGI